jgi:outer membrane lipoprotein SlyB
MFTLIKLAPSATDAQASLVATATRRPLISSAAAADAAVAGGGTASRPWFIAAGVLVVGVTAAAAIAWHSAAADGDDAAPAAPPSRSAQHKEGPATAKARDEAPARRATEPARQTAAQTPVCHSCGTVESVQALTHKGEGSGLGAVAGGVVGAAIGNQMGKGQGNAAMTVLGAVGGGLAGNEIEKRAKAKTSYRVTVKMEDGKTQVIEQAEPATVGQRVRVEGQTVKALPAQG